MRGSVRLRKNWNSLKFLLIVARSLVRRHSGATSRLFGGIREDRQINESETLTCQAAIGAGLLRSHCLSYAASDCCVRVQVVKKFGFSN
jgi:hypothetical protein